MSGRSGLLIAVLIAGLMVKADTAFAEADNVAEFVKMCSDPAQQQVCSGLLSAWMESGPAACIPASAEIIETLRKHPEWNDKSWTDGVEAAVETLCGK